jgi:hypothetical protein
MFTVRREAKQCLKPDCRIIDKEPVLHVFSSTMVLTFSLLIFMPGRSKASVSVGIFVCVKIHPFAFDTI